jgi:glucose/arabinose dehydrogenase
MTSLRSSLLALAAALALVAGACGNDDDPDTTTTTTTEVGETPTTDSDEDTTTTTEDPAEDVDVSEPVEDLSQADVVLTEVAELDQPVAIATREGSDLLYVAERTGRVVVLEPTADGPYSVGDTLVDVSGETTTESERGLLGLDFSPDGDRFYISLTDTEGDTRIDEWIMDGDEVDDGTRRTIYTQQQPYPNHNGGQLSFGPDGMLYLGLGDGGGSGDPLDAGQDPTTPLGSLIRIEPTEAGDLPFTSPDDNPFADGGGAPEVWATGLRNPWRFSWDRETDDLWIADVGQNEVEEINVVFADGDTSPGRGANFGWAIFEGDQPFDGGPEPENYVPPIYTFGHDPQCSVTGGYVARTATLPGLVGVYVYSDFCDPRIHLLLQRDGEVVETRALDVSVPGGQVVSFGEGPGGELYVLSLSGGVFRLDPAAP